MLDIGLNTFAEEEYSSDGIFIIDSEPTYEQLLEINNELYRELYFMKYAQFEKEVQDGFDMFANAFVACEYVQRNGIDEHITELIGNEGLLTDIKDVVVKFAKWLMSIIRKVIQWVASLFTKSIASYDKTSSKDAKQITVSLLRGDRSSRSKAVADFKQIASKIQNQSDSKADGMISIPDDLEEEGNNTAQFANIIGTLLSNGHPGVDFDLFKKIQKHTTFTFSKNMTNVKASVAAEYVLNISENMTKIRYAIMLLYNKLKEIPALSNNPTAEECNGYIQKVSKAFNLPFKEYKEKYSENAKIMQLKVQNMFKVFKGIYVIEAKLIKALFPIVNDIIRSGGATYKEPMIYGGNKYTINTYAVDYRIRIPQDLMNRMREAWKDDKLTINRLIISSVRKQSNRVLGMASIVGNEATKDIFISYNSFVSKLAVKKEIEEYSKYLEFNDINTKEYNINLSTDRVEQFLDTLVHECRHVYQFSNKKHIKDAGKVGSDDETHEKYLKYEHEMDARKAAANFKFKQEDVDWVKSILKNICKQIIETNRKRRSEKKSK